MKNPRNSAQTISPGRIWFVLLPALVVPFLGSLFYFTGWLSAELSRVVYLGTKIFTLLWPVVAWFYLDRAGLKLISKKGVGGKKGLGLGFASGLLMAALLLGLYLLSPLGSAVNVFSAEVAAKLEAFGVNQHYLLMAVLISTVHALLEEVYWRWLVFGQATRLMPLSGAHLLGALAFTAHHLVVVATYFPLPLALLMSFGVFCGGLVWSHLVVRTRSLVPSWISHMLVDAALFWIGWRMLHL